MSPLPPPPPSARPPTPQPRRKTSLRTVPKQVQEQFRTRLQELAADPRCVLPQTDGELPRALQKVAAGLDRLAKGKGGFLLRRDTGVVGAVARSIAMKDKPVPTRMLDVKVGGQRRFFVPRGQVERQVMAGVQNHDHAPSLLMAYRSLAKKHALHFFAAPQLWCTGDVPRPPQEWIDALAVRAKVTLEATDAGWTCGHEGGRVVLRFRGGPDLEVCASCGKTAGNMHRLVATRYAGPRQRQPFEVIVRAPDGQEVPTPREAVAEYRAGVKSEGDLLRMALSGWTPEGQVWMAAGRVHTKQEDWFDALDARPWERKALLAMAADGYKGTASTVADVLAELEARLPEGLDAILGSGGGGTAFLAAHQGQAVRDILRAAHEEASRRERVSALPQVRTGPVGTFLDQVARAHVAGGRQEALAAVKKAMPDVAGLHVAAALAALGGDVSLENRINAADREAASGLVAWAQQVLERTGQEYIEALGTYLREAGTGEHVRR